MMATYDMVSGNHDQIDKIKINSNIRLYKHLGSDRKTVVSIRISDGLHGEVDMPMSSFDNFVKGLQLASKLWKKNPEAHLVLQETHDAIKET